MSGAAGLSQFDDKRYLNLETYRKDGRGVRTPVWFAASSAAASGGNAPVLYVYTTTESGKAKRVRRSGTVRIAPCDARGKVTGAWVDAHARIAGGGEFVDGMQRLDRKYRPWKQLLDLSARLFRPRERIVLMIRRA